MLRLLLLAWLPTSLWLGLVLGSLFRATDEGEGPR